LKTHPHSLNDLFTNETLTKEILKAKSTINVNNKYLIQFENF